MNARVEAPARSRDRWRLSSLGLRQQRDALTLVQLSLAVLAVFLGNGGTPAAYGVAAALTAYAFWRPLPDEVSLGSQRAWTLLVFAALAASTARAILLLEFLDAGVDFLLLLAVQRFFNRQKPREHYQLLLLGAVLLVIAAVINADLNFPVILAAYLPVATMALALNLLLSEAERLGSRVQYELERGGRQQLGLLWRASFQVALIAAFGGAFVFVAFPRFGVGVFLRGSIPNQPTSGFSDEVRLGGFGNIKTDASVVMRLEPQGEFRNVRRLDWHLRASAFDTYDNGRWRHTEDAEVVALRSTGRFSVLVDERGPSALATGTGRRPDVSPTPVPGFAAAEEAVRVTVTLEDIGTDLLFAASEPVAIALRPRGALERQNRLASGVDRQVRIPGKSPGPVQYEFVSRIGQPTRAELLAVGDPAVPAPLAVYARPADGLSDEVHELAVELTANQLTRLEKVEALMDHLDDFAYTTELLRSQRVEDGADPVEGFLFDTRAGHCEYFATGLAVLAREAGIPARNVNGYYGAHYNPVGGFYAVRQADAHSWVEIYFDGIGWVTFDPTPPDGRTAGDDAPWFPTLSQWVDAARNTYLSYVIDYDLGKQLDLLENMGAARKRQGLPPELRWRGIVGWIAAPVVLVLLGFTLRSLLRRRTTPVEQQLYEQLLRLQQRRGRARKPEESASRFASRLMDDGAPEAEAMTKFARAYEARRFGPPGRGPSVDELRRLARDVQAARG